MLHALRTGDIKTDGAVGTTVDLEQKRVRVIIVPRPARF
jgi:hypothetical protein